MHADSKQVVNAAGHQGFMERVASAGANTAMESVWVLLQPNALKTGPWRTRAELNCTITYWIEHTHNERGCQRELGRHIPMEFGLAFISKTTRVAALLPQ